MENKHSKFSRPAGILLAAGSGNRYGARKQFESIDDQRLVDRSIALLERSCGYIVLVLPKGVQWSGPTVDKVVAGGESRVQSLANGLAGLEQGTEFVVVHDCARPLADKKTIDNLLDAVRAGADAAVPAWTSPDVIKRIKADGSLEHVGREGFVIVQGPNVCRTSVLEKALSTQSASSVEETEMIERSGGRVVAVTGNRWSHHLVDEQDLSYFSRLMPEK